MTTKIDQKLYLQKYISGKSGDKKKKKKKVIKGKGFKIIDDDLDLSKLRSLNGDELDIFDEGEDAPQIAGIIDERPEELKKLEQFRTTSKWKVVNQDDGFNSKLQIQEIKKDIKEAEKENELVFGKMYSDSEDEKNDEVLPPNKNKQTEDKTKRYDSDPNPPRRKGKHENSDSDMSPPRKHSKDNTKNSKKSVSHNSDSDFSPPRKKVDKETVSHRSNTDRPSRSDSRKDRVRKPSRWGDHVESKSSDLPYQRSKYSATPSPPSKSHKRHTDRNKTRRQSSDSDLSPHRKRRQSPEKHKSKKRSKSSDSDLSLPRKTTRRSVSPMKNSKDKRKNSDSDLSPPRKRKKSHRRNSDSPPPSNKKMAKTLDGKMAKTLDGKMAGLQDARQLRNENEAFRRREEEAFNQMADEVSGKNSQVVSRKKKRETSEDRQKQIEKAARQKVLDEKYKKWSTGLKQVEEQQARVADFIHEAAKPLARHRGDKDLEATLKDVEREGDPMLKFIRDRKRERGELGPEKPMYKGQFPPNRFNIRPGYRWDGVDRSNGYEKKFFDHQSKRKAQEEEAYKWSTEDL